VLAIHVIHMCTIQFVVCICLLFELKPFCQLVYLLHTNFFCIVVNLEQLVSLVDDIGKGICW
jgi:hypothetical protein